MIGELSMNPLMALPEVEANRGRRRGSGTAVGGVEVVRSTSIPSSYPYIVHNGQGRQQSVDVIMMEDSASTYNSRIQPVHVSVIDKDIGSSMMLVPSKSSKLSKEEQLQKRKQKQVLPPIKPKKLPSHKDLHDPDDSHGEDGPSDSYRHDYQQQRQQQLQNEQWPSASVLPPVKPPKLPSRQDFDHEDEDNDEQPDLQQNEQWTSVLLPSQKPQKPPSQSPHPAATITTTTTSSSCFGDDVPDAYYTALAPLPPLPVASATRTSCTTTATMSSCSTYVSSRSNHTIGTTNLISSNVFHQHQHQPCGGGLTAAAAIATGMCSDLSETEIDSQYESSTYRDFHDDDDDDDDEETYNDDEEEEEVDSLRPVLSSRKKKQQHQPPSTTADASDHLKSIPAPTSFRNIRPPKKPQRFISTGNSANDGSVGSSCTSQPSSTNRKKSNNHNKRRNANRRCSNDTQATGTSVSSIEVTANPTFGGGEGEDESGTIFSALSSDPGGCNNGGMTSDDCDTITSTTDVSSNQLHKHHHSHRHHHQQHNHHHHTGGGGLFRRSNSADDLPRRPFRKQDRCDTLSEDEEESKDTDEDNVHDDIDSNRPAVFAEPNSAAVGGTMTDSSFSERLIPGEDVDDIIHPIIPLKSHDVQEMGSGASTSSKCVTASTFDDLLSSHKPPSPILPAMKTNLKRSINDDETEDDDGYREDDDDDEEEEKTGTPPLHFKAKSPSRGMAPAGNNSSPDVHLPALGAGSATKSTTSCRPSSSGASATSGVHVTKPIPLVGLGPSKKESRWAGAISKKTTIGSLNGGGASGNQGPQLSSSYPRQQFLGDRIPYSPRRRSADAMLLHKSLNEDGSIHSRQSSTSEIDISDKPTSASGDTLPTAPRRASYGERSITADQRRPSCDTLPIIPLRQLEELELNGDCF